MVNLIGNCSSVRRFDSRRKDQVMAKKTKRSRPWSREDVQMLKTMVREKSKTSFIARKLKRTPTATRQKAASLDVKLVGASQRRRKG
jgi:hypothetical protein